MSITCFVSGDWFPHHRKITLEDKPKSLDSLLAALSKGLGERITRVFHYEPSVSFFVQVDDGCVCDISHNSRLEAHRSSVAQAAARRHDATANPDHFCPSTNDGDSEEAVAGAERGWDHFSGGGGSTVTINVGGKLFTTRVDTLTRFGDSLLAAMFEGRIPVSRDSAGRVFVDRDPKTFQQVLTYLRDGSIPIPRDACKAQGLLAESRYFQLADLEEMCQTAWKQVLVATFYSYRGDALVNTVHLDGPPSEIKRLRNLLNQLLGPEHFTYLLDGTVLAICLDGVHGGTELPSHGLGGWNHGNSLCAALSAGGWELWAQDMTGMQSSESEEGGGVGGSRDSGGGSSISDFLGGGGGGGKVLGGSGKGGGGRGMVGGRAGPGGCLVSRFVWKR